MPGWLSRAAAWASRSTRRPASPPLLDRLHRDRALEAPVPGLVDDAEAAAADAALDQEAVEDERTDQCYSQLRRAGPLPAPVAPSWEKGTVCGASWRFDHARVHTSAHNQLESTSLGGFARTPPRRRPGTPTRTPADHAAARARARRRPGRPDPDRARGQGLPRRPRRPRAQRLRPQRHPDRRRDRADEQSLLRQARRPRQRSR